METLGLLSIFPPLVAIILSLTTRRVLPSLLAGVVAAQIVIHLGEPLRTPAALIDHLSKIASNYDNLQLIAFSLLVGALLKLMRDSNAFAAFAQAVERVRKDYGRGSLFAVTYGLSSTLVLEVWSNVLINGATLSPLYDRLGVARQRLAYFLHTIGLNTVAVVLVNGWGAFYMGLLATQQVEQPFQFLLRAIPYNLYGFASLALVIVVMATGLALGPMRAADRAAKSRATAARADAREGVAPKALEGPKPRLVYMLAPIATLFGTVFLSLYLTGGGDITKGAGTASIFYAVVAAVTVLAALLLAFRAFTFLEVETKVIAGMQELVDVAILIVLAFALGDLCRQMGTGPYLSSLAVGAVPLTLIPAAVFLLGALMSFATGTSYGTLSILLPIVLPLAAGTGLDAALLFGACLSGSLFGDHNSPISDTSIMTSVGTGVPVVEHIRTQLPYSLIAAGVAAAAFSALAALA